ncbi:hypothetical protein D9619_012671 [Psilocybe cf. subviscida]|uniref:Uncharacterized protein n=1 Tax=Psilocybe cf. subviscida TaxID=2480587 RepID=A0A8H5B742_9AGAR|nr:hypothetical protein D9619_012671 [Psilocybe cf. subviscida]
MLSDPHTQNVLYEFCEYKRNILTKVIDLFLKLLGMGNTVWKEVKVHALRPSMLIKCSPFYNRSLNAIPTVSLRMTQPLAIELYHAIIQHIDNRGDLLSLSLCCLAFRNEAQRCLFRHVEPYSERQLIRLMSTINASPLRLGPLIHTFRLNDVKESAPDEGNEDPAAPLSISMALRSMCNLEHLRIERSLPSTILQGCTFKLRTLVWHGYLEKPSLSFLFYHFLPTQHSIKRLNILYHRDPDDSEELPTDLCPTLDSLKSNDRIIISCLLRNDRLITRFQRGTMGNSMPTMTIRQLNHLKYLQCLIYYLDMDTSSSFTLQLTSLVLLELHLSYKPQSVDLLIKMLQFLKHLPCLEVLVVENHFKNNLNFSSAYQHAFELRPTLKYIDVEHQPNKFYVRFFPPGNGVLVRRRVHQREVLGWRRQYGVGPAYFDYV